MDPPSLVPLNGTIPWLSFPLSDSWIAFLTPHVATEVCHLLAAAGYGHVVSAFLDDIGDGFYELVRLDALK